MALLWESLATREVKLLKYAMQRRFRIPDNCAWVNYVRVHDDIGWSFADEDAQALWINPFEHRQFLNRFYQARHRVLRAGRDDQADKDEHGQVDQAGREEQEDASPVPGRRAPGARCW